MSDRVHSSRLAAQVKAGEREAFKEVYLRYFERVYAYMDLLLQDPTEADTATQEMFRALLSNISSYHERAESFEAWLCRLMRSVARDRVEMCGQETSPPVRSDMPEPDLAAIPDDDILRLIELLPTAERELVVLHYTFGLAVGELGPILGASPEEVRSRHRAALDRLNAMLARTSRITSASGTVSSR